MFRLLVIIGIIAVVAISGCGDKFSLPSDLPPPDYKGSAADTSYILITPNWTGAGGTGFKNPADVFIGYDQFIYICDTDNDRVVKIDLDGSLLASYPIVHPVAIAQDRGLDLLVVCGDYMRIRDLDSTRDTTIYGNAVYRRKYFGDGSFQPVFRDESGYEVIVHGNSIRIPEEYWGIAASVDPDKHYFIADFGKNRILRLNSSDSPVFPPLVQEGSSYGTTQYPVDLFSYSIAGLSYLAFAQGIGNLGVQIVSPINGRPFFTDTTALPALVRFSNRGFKDVAVDELSNFYVLVESPDAILNKRHYFYKFNRYGEPILEFGTLGSGERQFRTPRGIAYFKGIVYIADTGNNRIVRYQLSTDVQQ